METFFFCVGSPTCAELTIGSWNVHGIGNKFENRLCLQLLQKYDLFFVNELKTAKTFSIPGYVVYCSDNRNPKRGGSALFIRNNLVDCITWMDTSAEGQIWLTLSFLPYVMIGGCYIPPADSPYYDVGAIADIEARMMLNTDSHFIVIGDFNARCSKDVESIASNVQANGSFSYEPSTDSAIVANPNGKHLVQLCKDCQLLILNNLKFNAKRFPGGLTFRRKNQWISEIDLCLLSPQLVPAVTSFDIDHDVSLPSDHAPIGLSVHLASLSHLRMENLLLRASALGDHAVLHTQQSQKRLTKRPLKFDEIDCESLSGVLQNLDPPMIVDDVDLEVEKLSDVLYSCANEAVRKQNGNNMTIREDNRWQHILNSKDHKKLWNAISWKGQVTKETMKSPSSEEFCNHLEELYNPDSLEGTDFSDIHPDVTIPLLDKAIHPIEVENVLRCDIKPNKGSGPDGIPPGLLSLLPMTWIVSLATLFNVVFNDKFPHSWAYARLVMLFKKGKTNLCDNYRGISMLNSLAKVYDYVLYRRLVLWFTPSREQAGAQKGRGCIEHIVSLRLLMDYCVTKKCKLYIVYIDF